MPVTRLAGGGRRRRVAGPGGAGAPGRRQLPPLPATQIDPRDAALARPQRGLSLSFAEPMADRRSAARCSSTGTPFSLSIDRRRDRDLPRRAEAAHAARGADDAADAARTRLRGPGHGHPRHAAPRRDAAVRSEPAERAARHAADRRQRRRRARRSRRRSTPDDVFARDRGRRQVAPVGDADASTSIARSGLALVSDFPERLDRVALYLETLHRAAAVRCGSRRRCSK